MDVDRACLTRIREAPYVLEQAIPRQHHARLPAERFEELELLRAQRDGALTDQHLVPRRIDAEVADTEDATASGHARGAPEDRSNA